MRRGRKARHDNPPAAARAEPAASHYPEYIEPTIDRKIRERFPIVLATEDMRPGNGRW